MNYSIMVTWQIKTVWIVVWIRLFRLKVHEIWQYCFGIDRCNFKLNRTIWKVLNKWTHLVKLLSFWHPWIDKEKNYSLDSKRVTFIFDELLEPVGDIEPLLLVVFVERKNAEDDENILFSFRWCDDERMLPVLVEERYRASRERMHRYKGKNFVMN